MDVLLPLYHAGGFNWDEALVLVGIVLTVVLIARWTDRRGNGE
jgi:hypothetical protein